MEVIEIIFAIIQIVGVVLFFIAMPLLPSVINIGVSLSIAWLFKRVSSSLLVLIPIFLLVSFLLSMNVRLLELASDFTPKVNHVISLDEKVNVKFGTTLSFTSNLGHLSFKESPLAITTLGGDEGCMCTYYVNPDVITEDFEKEIRDYGLIITNTPDSDLSLSINVNKNENVAIVNLELKKNGVTIAKDSIRVRQKYNGDTDLAIRGKADDGSLFSHFTSNTFWNGILKYSGIIPDQGRFVRKFLRENITIKTAKKEAVKLKAIVIDDPNINEDYILSQGRSGDVASCQEGFIEKEKTFFSNKRIYLNKSGTIIPIEHSLQDIEKIICLEGSIYLVSTPQYRSNKIIIYNYSYGGINNENYIYEVPRKSWLGYPRKPLVYFELQENSIIAGIQQFGENIETEYFYYNLERSMPNK